MKKNGFKIHEFIEFHEIKLIDKRMIHIKLVIINH